MIRQLSLKHAGNFLCLLHLLFIMHGGLPLATGQTISSPLPEKSLIGQFEKPPELTVRLVADSSQISHPIAFSVDDFGRIFVAESFRYIDQRGGWTDIRYRMPWMDEDLASRSIADRKKLYESRLGPELPEWKKAPERVRLLENPDTNGVYQNSSVFADGFNNLLDGTMAGLLATRDKVYVTNIPSLWQLDGANRQISNRRTALHTGFGVRLGYLGHDLHGLCWGPDGRLYFSLGDRGARIEKDGKLLVDLPDTGGVFRCEADGSNLELFAKGLRNPQELAFDALGNLWTCDNNADRGDRARWVWVLPGGDSGWRIGYQHLNTPVALGAWTSEKIWFPAHAEQAGHIVPPVANLAQGPSGVAAHPGTGLPSQFTGQFLVCDYLGDGGGIYSVTVRRSGAGYEMLPPGRFLWRTPANDVDFSPDGAVLLTTWTGGIAPSSSGALYRVESPGLKDDLLAQSTANILKTDPATTAPQTLATWLEHPDMRVRRHGQFEIVKRGRIGTNIFLNCINRSSQQLARITALWGLAQMQRLQKVSFPEEWKAWQNDPDPEFRATLARVLGESKPNGSVESLIGLLNDADDRVKLWACLGLAQSPGPQATAHLFRLAEAKNDFDPWLRHGISSALASCANASDLVAQKNAGSVAVRRAALLALRKQKNDNLQEFLTDSSPLLVTDAVRAIYEERITRLNDLLAIFNAKTTLNSEWSDFNREALLRRWIHTNLRQGKSQNAERLIAFAADTRFPENLRVETLTSLAAWAKPSQFDGIQGLYNPIAEEGRESHAAKLQFSKKLDQFLNTAQSPAIQLAALQFLEKNGPGEFQANYISILKNTGFALAVQSKALEMLVKSGSSDSASIVNKALRSDKTELKLKAIELLDALAENDRLTVVKSVLADGRIDEKQRAIRLLGHHEDPESLKIMSSLVDQLTEGKLPPELHLEVRESADELAKAGRNLRNRLDNFHKMQLEKDPLAKWNPAISGGNAEAGKQLFTNRTDLS
ncbi:MAG: HEAT repeat domain-containing protein, partial [Isosphaeraceae bacterium]